VTERQGRYLAELQRGEAYWRQQFAGAALIRR